MIGDPGNKPKTASCIMFIEAAIRCADIFANSLRIHENFKNLGLFLGTPKIYYTCKSFEQVHSPHPLQFRGWVFQLIYAFIKFQLISKHALNMLVVWITCVWSRCFFTLYHGKAPLKHHLMNIFSSHHDQAYPDLFSCWRVLNPIFPT